MRQDILEGIRRHIQPLAGVEHAQILEIAPGHAKLGLDILPCSLNLYGTLHGGVIFTLCDMAAGMATYAYEVSNVTQQGCIHFIKSVDSGKLYVQADAVHKGSKTAIHHVVITTPEGKTVADATFTMFLFDPI